MKNHLIGVLVLAILISACRPQNPPRQFTKSKFPFDSTVVKLMNLPAEIDESSGIIKIGNSLWTHNDSGDDPKLYEIDLASKQLVRIVNVERAKHRDWEDISQDSLFVYVGDFGNNIGDRQDLTIYRVPKSGLAEGQEAVSAEKITFRYPEQKRFDTGAYKHNFDCEGMIRLDSSLFLFTKNHDNGRCSVYELPIEPGEYEAQLIDSMDTEGVITGADIDTESGVICLSGYTLMDGFEPFIWVLSDYSGHTFFQGKHQRLELTFLAQTEGICTIGGNQFYLSCEAEDNGDPRVFLFDANRWLK
ncbi:MAG: hypothetical protein AAF206_26795 [Bacteroidota bacterium]